MYDKINSLPFTSQIKALREKYVSLVPKRYREILLRSYEHPERRANAIRAKCLDCSNYTIKEVKLCSVYTCPLHSVRPYQNGEEETEDQNTQDEIR